MRWDQLTEANVTKRNLVSFIKKNCSEYLRENPDWMNSPLYRGISDSEDIIIKNIRTDREPTDMKRYFHDLYDDTLKKAGFVARRSNSMFVTGHKSVADQYGYTMVIFPIGNFEYTWSSSYSDLLNVLPTIYLNGGIAFKNADKDVLTIDDLDLLPSELGDYKVPKKFSFNYMKDVIFKETGNNIRLWLRSDDIDEVFRKLEIDQNVLIDNFKNYYSNNDLEDAIESGSEIMIAGTSYLAIEPDIFEQMKEKFK